MKRANFSIRSRIRSFHFAWQGILAFIRGEHNAWLHAVATVAVIILAAIVGVSKTEQLALVFVIALVWVTEILNTCIERIMDFISEQQHPDIKFIKDLSAGAVLVAAIAALLTGAIIFIPKLFHV